MCAGAWARRRTRSALEGGLSAKAKQAVDKIGEGVKAEVVDAELEGHRKDLAALRAEVELAGRRLEAEADARAVEVRRDLGARARRESDGMKALLERQRTAIDKAEARLRQADWLDTKDKDQQRHVKLDLAHLERRREAAAQERETEPAAIEALYDVRKTRLLPVGLVVAWPEMMT